MDGVSICSVFSSSYLYCGVVWSYDGHRTTGGPELSNSTKWTMVFGQLQTFGLGELRCKSWLEIGIGLRVLFAGKERLAGLLSCLLT